MIYNELAKVLSNKEIAEGIFQTDFFSPNISAISLPGQFVNILPSIKWANVMRRPMSIANQGRDQISIIYKPIGEGTRIMANWDIGEEVDLIGPLGNNWEGYKSSLPVIIGGGVGIAPIINFHYKLQSERIQHILIMGARHEAEHFLNHDPEQNIFLSTDDGSLGVKGTVVDVLKELYPNSIHPDKAKLFSCGPPMMMDSVRKYSLNHSLDCQLALETIMACGVGICQGCTIEKNIKSNKDHTYRNRFSLVCIDGPIFNAKDIILCE